MPIPVLQADYDPGLALPLAPPICEAQYGRSGHGVRDDELARDLDHVRPRDRLSRPVAVHR